MRSAFSSQHFTIRDLATGEIIPEVINVGGHGMAHETEKIRTATPQELAATQGGYRDENSGNATGIGRYLNISGNSEPEDPFFDFVLSDLSRDTLGEYSAWERECRLNPEGGISRDFEIIWYRNENLDIPVAQVLIYNARCKSFGKQGDSSSNNGGEKQTIYRVQMECESNTAAPI
ncbi:hypothetical protein IHN63_00510 [Deinococcus sp. 6YEL10]|uniref:hypothetical protein n=1 Tax=Deinococcus sp. 6YEL10 TaxID=2745870 RepID=UPI001E5E3499|nr:hypothetical protein [Deinococcus sp. 6YEL10]MCD0159781.1 hypothetical protein [Deinococcus sp. 6YEL10]